MPTQNGEAQFPYISVGVGGAVGGAVVVLVAAVIVLSVTVCLKKKKSEHVIALTDNVAYG